MARAPLPLRRKILYGGLVAALLLAALEGVLRAGLGPPPPPIRVYNALQEHERWFDVADGHVVATYVRPSPPSPFPAAWSGGRAAVLGGSPVHAGTPNLGPDEEFPGLLSRLTGRTVINLGSPGLDSFDMVEIVEDLVAWPWTAFIVYAGHNDFGNIVFQARYGDLWSGLGAHTRSALEHFQLFVQLHRLLSPIEGSPRGFHDKETHAEHALLTDTQRDAALRYLEANLRRIVWTANRKGIRVILVPPVSRLLEEPGDDACAGQPDCAIDLYNQAEALRSTDPVAAGALYRRARDRDRVAIRAPTEATAITLRVAEEEGAIYVDAESLLPQEAGLAVPAERLFYDGVHFSAEGHRAIAELLTARLQEAMAP